MQPVCIESNRAYQATRAYSTPPVFPEWDERHETSDYGLVHLATNKKKRLIFHAIINLLLPNEAALVIQARKVFVVQVNRAVKEEIYDILQALEQHPLACLPSSPPFASSTRYLHYLQMLPEALEGRPPRGFRFAATKKGRRSRGFRFAATKAVDEEETYPYDVKMQIYKAAEKGKLDELLGLCQEWAGRRVIDPWHNVSTRILAIFLLAYSSN